MCRKLTLLIFIVLVIGIVNSASANLVAHWKFDDGAGNVAKDSAGTNDGALRGGPIWVVGAKEGALRFDGTDDCVDVGNNSIFNPTASFSVALWANIGNWSTEWVHTLIGNRNDGVGWCVRRFGGWWATQYPTRYTMPTNALSFTTRGVGHSEDGVEDTPSSTVPPQNEWVHIACVYDNANNKKYIYFNGVQNMVWATRAGGRINTATQKVYIGARSNAGNTAAEAFFTGMLDDVRFYDHALSLAEVQTIMKGETAGAASEPQPSDKATDIIPDVILSWKPGKYAAKHNVYFGTTSADVNAATTTTHPNVEVSLNQAAGTFDPPGLLTLGQTYYWRVDEVNAPPNTTTYPGPLWSFTVESVGYQIKNITPYASSQAPNMGPEKTIDGSGLTNDLHGTADTTMWLSNTTPQPTWIKYEFDKVYKLDKMWVWNSNLTVESFIGYGIKNATIEYSTDNATWTQLSGVADFNQAPGAADYLHNTTINFGGVTARYVRITANSNWKGITQQYGLSEVRFFYIPVQARDPNPLNGQTDVALDASLRWRAGREAAIHNLYISTNRQAVVNGTVAPINVSNSGSYNSYGPLSLELGKTYYWKVNEVNNTTTWPGDVWSFISIGYLMVETFEDYNNSSPKRIFQTWLDGIGYSADQYFPTAYPGNGSGAGVGHDIWTPGGAHFEGDIMEKGIVHGGSQSMPLYYDDANSPYYSETERVWTAPQDWTRQNVKSLTVWFRGAAAFVETSPGIVFMSGTGSDIWDTADQFRFAYKQLTGNGSIIARVESIQNTDPWAKVGVMIRQSLDAGSTHAMVVVSSSQGVAFQYRATAGGSSTNVQQAGITAPHWVKITRTGSTFTVAHSDDGVTWVNMGTATSSVDIQMTDPVYIGLAVTSHATGSICGVKFSGVSLSVTGQWQSADIGVAQPVGNQPEPLYVAIDDGTPTGKKTITNSDPNATLQGDWQEFRIPLSAFTGVNLKNIKKMYIGTGNKTSPKAGSTGILYVDDIRLYPARCMPAIVKPAMDLNNDCAVDYLELDMMADQWLKTAPPALSTDFNADNKVDLKDFAKLAQNWLEEILWP